MTAKEVLKVAKFVLEDQREYLLPQSVDHPKCLLCKYNWDNIISETLDKVVKKFAK